MPPPATEQPIAHDEPRVVIENPIVIERDAASAAVAAAVNATYAEISASITREKPAVQAEIFVPVPTTTNAARIFGASSSRRSGASPPPKWRRPRTVAASATRHCAAAKGIQPQTEHHITRQQESSRRRLLDRRPVEAVAYWFRAAGSREQPAADGRWGDTAEQQRWTWDATEHAWLSEASASSSHWRVT